MTAVVETPGYFGEEALLEAYELQWKAIDIRVERLRNECERMILEYEVELKQQMYIRECEELVRLSKTQPPQPQRTLEPGVDVDRKQADKETQRKPESKTSADEAPVKAMKQKPATAKFSKPKAAAPKVPVKSVKEQPIEKKADLSGVADDDLLQMLSQDQEYESEDFNGDAPALSLIHPDSQAMLSPNRLKKHKDEQKSRLMVAARMKMMDADSSSEPASEPEPRSFTSSDSSPSPLVELQEKRALKRRKTAVLGPETVKTTKAKAVGATGKTAVAKEKKKAQTKAGKQQDSDDESAVTGRSKARKTAKVTGAALREHAEEEVRKVTGISAAQEISTPTVPRKKPAKDTKAKQQQRDAALINNTEDDDTPAVGKKRRRPDEAADVFETPKKAKKIKPKATKNQFANDELNIMKSPVPMLRAKLAEKKRKEETEKKTKKKRTASERDDVDDEDSYDGQALAIPVSTVLASERLPAPISIKPAQTFGINPKTLGKNVVATAASDYAARWLNEGLVTRAKKNASKKAPSKSPKPAALWGGSSFFDAFVNNSTAAIPRLKSSSTIPKSTSTTAVPRAKSSSTLPKR